MANWYSSYKNLSIDDLKQIRSGLVEDIKQMHMNSSIPANYRDGIVLKIREKIDAVNQAISEKETTTKGSPKLDFEGVQFFVGDKAKMDPEMLMVNTNKKKDSHNTFTFVYCVDTNEIVTLTNATHFGIMKKIKKGLINVSPETLQYVDLNMNETNDYYLYEEHFIEGRVNGDVMTLWPFKGGDITPYMKNVLGHFPQVKEAHIPEEFNGE